ncbi:ArsC/Spx/MgsR family protein [Lactococcus garvieae]|uniref:ArsC/Spx/MgsR family protein n=1 Tax=Lactococcus garvieae TaxID=1363 RepID=UPI003255022D
MITLYYSLSSTSSKQAMNWFKSRDMKICKKRGYDISREDILRVLSLSETGFSEFLKSRGNTGRETQEKLAFVESLSFSEAIDYVLAHPEIIRLPITFDDKRLLVGFNGEEIRQFIPKAYRKLEVSEWA